ncbi:hypothetical protein JFK97_19155 [Chromobacterium phragmitis]|uniref:LPD7 domain-containing protein n=1 Tax=Chromobacterium amazonense TaxID=1382803 RepID=UPI0021B7E47C|nr:LPD7 domain-containing protein [Chromobacterium amazonense]MBM2886512.1 hypothetical protein [Chromobacterium amazonense]
MLVKLGGGKAGFKAYLETGQKSGREYSRDQLDKRIFLNDANLSHFETICESINGDGGKYYHLTFGFKEDYVSEDVMRAVVELFQNEVMRPVLRGDEYYLYAEAHIPKIKSYIDKKTGQVVQRLPHIHIGIPQVNLLTGKQLTLFAKPEMIVPYIDAFKEKANNLFGFASPLEHRRIHIEDGSDILSRYKGDYFEGQRRELKEEILASMVEDNVETVEAFRDLLGEFGTVRVRNEGKKSEYFAVHPEGYKNGVNLKEFVFSKEFIEKPTAEKIKLIEKEIEDKYLEAGEARRNPEYIEQKLQEWREVRGPMMNYYRDFNQTERKLWKLMDTEQRKAFLADKAADFYAKADAAISTTGGVLDTAELPEFNPEKVVTHERNQHDIRPNVAGIGREPPPRARGRLRNLSELDVVRIESGGEMLLPSDVSQQLEHQRAERNPAVRRPVTGERRLEKPVCAVGQIKAELVERRADPARTAERSEFDTIKSELMATTLLNYVSHTHGVNPDKYQITQDEQGRDRIQCGTRSLTVNDFLTKELALPWVEAKAILREAFSLQNGELVPERAQRMSRELYNEYRDYQKRHWEERRSDLAKVAEQDKTQRATVRQRGLARRLELYQNTTLTAGQRRAAVSLVRMDTVVALRDLRVATKSQREAIKGRSVEKSARHQFLWHLSQQGNAEALALLRRAAGVLALQEKGNRTSSPETTLAREFTGTVTGEPPRVMNSVMDYRVNEQGDVTYLIDGREALRDERNRVSVLDQNDTAIEMGLQLAVQKFGGSITLTGDDDFKLRTVEIAVQQGIFVRSWNDQRLADYEKHLRDQLRHGDQYREKAMQAQQQREARPQGPAMPQPAKPVEPKQIATPAVPEAVEKARAQHNEKFAADKPAAQPSQQQKSDNQTEHKPAEPDFDPSPRYDDDNYRPY